MSTPDDIGTWNASVRQICGEFSTIANPAAPFIGHIHLADLGGLGVAHIETNACTIKRRMSDRQNDQNCFLIMQIQGEMGFTHGAQEQILLRPGEAALLDSALAYDMHPQGLIRQISVHLPRDQVRQQLQRPQLYGKLPHDSLSGQMLHNMLQQLCYENAPFSVHATDGCALQDALSALLRPAFEGRNSSAEEQPLRQLAERCIRRHLHDYRLTPAFVAQELQISKRKLYRLFEADGESVSAHILRLRLQQSALELGKPGQTALNITEIAFRWGFSDVSQFSRAFKRMTGLSPRAYRQQHNQSA